MTSRVAFKAILLTLSALIEEDRIHVKEGSFGPFR
jgi:hypothetical protein